MPGKNRWESFKDCIQIVILTKLTGQSNSSLLSFIFLQSSLQSSFLRRVIPSEIRRMRFIDRRNIIEERQSSANYHPPYPNPQYGAQPSCRKSDEHQDFFKIRIWKPAASFAVSKYLLLHLGHFRITASDIRSSMNFRLRVSKSVRTSSQRKGMCSSLWHSRHDSRWHNGFGQSKTLFSSFSISFKNPQNGHDSALIFAARNSS